MRYITKEGDRWDWISYQFYHNPDMYREIIKVNTHLPLEVILSPVLPAGIELEIPEIEVEEKSKELPPWKR